MRRTPGSQDRHLRKGTVLGLICLGFRRNVASCPGEKLLPELVGVGRPECGSHKIGSRCVLEGAAGTLGVTAGGPSCQATSGVFQGEGPADEMAGKHQ